MTAEDLTSARQQSIESRLMWLQTEIINGGWFKSWRFSCKFLLYKYFTSKNKITKKYKKYLCLHLQKPHKKLNFHSSLLFISCVAASNVWLKYLCDIRRYVPVMEFEDFMKYVGYHGIDYILYLQRHPEGFANGWKVRIVLNFVKLISPRKFSVWK